jgi:Na+-transporting NADH:ubiquinone oxidoreductase subunit B
MAIWNTGVQSVVYASGDPFVVKEYLQSCHSLVGYLHFVGAQSRWISILQSGCLAFFPVMAISYIVGGSCEAVFAVLRKKPIAEGFLVTGMLFPLILPPTIPYWMVAVGVASGVVLSKELFGGTGMNVMNPALCCRALLFFAFPMNMTGDVWVGTNTSITREAVMKVRAANHVIDGFSQATPLAYHNVDKNIARIHVDAIATQFADVQVHSRKYIDQAWENWSKRHDISGPIEDVSPDVLRQFVIGKAEAGGLHLSPESYESAKKLAQLTYGQGILTDWNFFLGNKAGCFGETSVLACLLGAVLLIITGVGSWKVMTGVLGGAYFLALFMQFGSFLFGIDSGVWNPALFALPAYKHLLLGGLAFGAVFMATDPVSCPVLGLARWIYGIFIGAMTIVIRNLNPAFPEGVMLAILLGNTIAPLLDHHVAKLYRRWRVLL